jgi:hypothetical protein
MLKDIRVKIRLFFFLVVAVGPLFFQQQPVVCGSGCVLVSGCMAGCRLVVAYFASRAHATL